MYHKYGWGDSHNTAIPQSKTEVLLYLRIMYTPKLK